MFMVVICWVSDGKDIFISPKQLQALFTDVRHWEEPIDSIVKNEGVTEPCILSSLFMGTLE